MKVINLLLGDWSGDGHSITETVTIECNRNVETLKMAYERGVELTGINLTKDICSDYEDNKVSSEIIETLKVFGMVDLPDTYDEDSYSFWTDTYANTWLFIAKVGDPELEFKIVKNQSINIGGYGLYGN